MRCSWSLVVRGIFRRMASFIDQHGALEGHHFNAILIQPPNGNRYDPLLGSALRFALAQDRALSVDDIAGEDRMDRLHLVPAQVGDHFSADRTHAHTGKQCECESRIHQRLLPFGLGSVGRVELELLRIHREQREPTRSCPRQEWCDRGDARTRRRARNLHSRVPRSRDTAVYQPLYRLAVVVSL
jgi:hypothetical protein